MSLEIYSDGESFLYKPVNLNGFLLLNYNKIQKQIYYKFFNEELNENVNKIEDKISAINLYNLFQKYLTEYGDIEVISLSDFDDDNEEMSWEEIENPDLENYFGFEYSEENDILIIKEITDFILI